MKIKEGFVLRSVMGNYVVVAVGEASKSFRGMVKLNSTAADVWQMAEKGCSEEEMCEALLEKYEVERERVESDLRAVLKGFEEQGFIER